MINIALLIDNAVLRLTLKTILEADGHKIVQDTHGAQVQFTDPTSAQTIEFDRIPTILLASASEISIAAEAMTRGAWGYIFVPLQPHEASLAAERALAKIGPPSRQSSLADLRSMETIEFEHIALALRLCNGNQAKAARALNIGRNTLWRKLKKMEQQEDND